MGGGAANEVYGENLGCLNYLNVIVGSSLYITFGNKRRAGGPAASAELKFSFSLPFLHRARSRLYHYFTVSLFVL